jgi:hypothetical protein
MLCIVGHLFVLPMVGKWVRATGLCLKSAGTFPPCVFTTDLGAYTVLFYVTQIAISEFIQDCLFGA